MGPCMRKEVTPIQPIQRREVITGNWVTQNRETFTLNNSPCNANNPQTDQIRGRKITGYKPVPLTSSGQSFYDKLSDSISLEITWRYVLPRGAALPPGMTPSPCPSCLLWSSVRESINQQPPLHYAVLSDRSGLSLSQIPSGCKSVWACVCVCVRTVANWICAH